LRACAFSGGGPAESSWGCVRDHIHRWWACRKPLEDAHTLTSTGGGPAESPRRCVRVQDWPRAAGAPAAAAICAAGAHGGTAAGGAATGGAGGGGHGGHAAAGAGA